MFAKVWAGPGGAGGQWFLETRTGLPGDSGAPSSCLSGGRRKTTAQPKGAGRRGHRAGQTETLTTTVQRQLCDAV